MQLLASHDDVTLILHLEKTIDISMALPPRHYTVTSIYL